MAHSTVLVLQSDVILRTDALLPENCGGLTILRYTSN